MKNLKKAWITEISSDISSLTLESLDPYNIMIAIESRFYPDMPSPKPLRHVNIIRGLGDEDLLELYDVIGKYLIQGICDE